MSSELGNLLELKEVNISAELLVALQGIQACLKAEFYQPFRTTAEKLEAKLTDAELEADTVYVIGITINSNLYVFQSRLDMNQHFPVNYKLVTTKIADQSAIYRG